MTASNLFLKIEKTILANIIVSCIIAISLGVFEMPFIHFFIYSSIISFFILKNKLWYNLIHRNEE